MEIAYDLHIHSALSPCGNNDMTPNNIVNMAFVKGLKLIAITDHNAMSNVAPAIEAAKTYNMLVLPGMEVTTKEDIHVLCYFSELSAGLEFENVIYEGLPDIDNIEEYFGDQLIFDKNDKVIGKLKKLLISSTKYSIKEINDLIKKYNGVMVPAHIDKNAYSVISSLGFIPDSLKVNAVEIYNNNNFYKISNLIDKNKYITLNSSDAHYLTDINEAVFFLHLETLTAESVINYLNGRGNKH